MRNPYASKYSILITQCAEIGQHHRSGETPTLRLRAFGAAEVAETIADYRQVIVYEARDLLQKIRIAPAFTDLRLRRAEIAVAAVHAVGWFERQRCIIEGLAGIAEVFGLPEMHAALADLQNSIAIAEIPFIEHRRMISERTEDYRRRNRPKFAAAADWWWNG